MIDFTSLHDDRYPMSFLYQSIMRSGQKDPLPYTGNSHLKLLSFPAAQRQVPLSLLPLFLQGASLAGLLTELTRKKKGPCRCEW